MINNKFGFTLIELLVVVAIIGILAAVGMGGVYLRTREAARDGKRVSDIQMIKNAQEQRFVAEGSYVCPLANLGTAYLPAGAPIDPLSPDRDYTCNITSGVVCVCAHLENNTKGNMGASCVASATTHYCIVGAQ